MAFHQIELKSQYVHGQFSRDLSPVLSIDSGDRVKLRTADVTWGLEQHDPAKSSRQRLKNATKPRDDGPCLVGPIAVRGAKPGHVLEISFNTIRPNSWGWTYAGPSLYNEPWLKKWDVSGESLMRWHIDPQKNIAQSEDGLTIQTHPFLGTVGMPANTEGWQSGWLPRQTGGNMDCKYLQEGALLQLPVEVDQALLSLGDGHAAQANGELAGSAIECMMDEIIIEVTVREDLPLAAPRVLFENKTITLGFGKTLERATDQAVKAMLDILCHELEVSSSTALAYASTLVDLEITQIVNGTMGVHAIWDKDKIT